MKDHEDKVGIYNLVQMNEERLPYDVAGEHTPVQLHGPTI